MLILPASIQIVHAFEQHEQTICTSDVENHLHQDDVECVLCHLQAKSFAILPKESFYLVPKKITKENNRIYRFLFNHQHLSFSVRGPPIF